MPGKGQKKLCLLGWLLALCGPLPSALGSESTRPLSVARITTVDGLTQSTVYATLQDSQGFLWLATEDGLIRYDGRDLIRYGYSRNNPAGPPGNFIRDLIEDSQGNLWVAFKDAGLARWNRATDTFTRFKHEPSDRNSLASNLVRALLLDKQGRLWIGMPDAGIDVLDPRTLKLTHLRHDRQDPASLVDDQVNTLALGRDGSIWVGTDNGLSRFNPATLRAERLRLPIDRISQVLEDSRGRLWIGSYAGGLVQLSTTSQVEQHYRHAANRPQSLSHDDVRALLEDRQGRLWIGTAAGLDLLDQTTGGFDHYGPQRDDPTSLSDSFIMSLYQDPAGLIWIGTRSGGVNRWNPHSWEMGGHRPAALAGALVTSFADADSGRLWIGSAGGGLVRFDPRTGATEPLAAVLGRRKPLPDSRVMSLLLDRRGTLWIGTMSHGLRALRPDGRLDAIPVGRGLPNGTSAPGLMTLYEARDGQIWIGTYGGGANILDPATGQVRQLPFNDGKPASLSGTNVSAFAQDAEGNVWIATDGGGLNVTRPDGTLIRTFQHDPADPNSLASNTLYSLAADGAGRIWIGTDGGGLDQVDGDSRQAADIRFINLSRADGLSSDTVYGVLTDARGRLWLSGNSGLTRFDPRDRSIKTYHREHGLQGEEFNFNAYFRSRTGLLLFGGPGGFNAFDPGRLTDRQSTPRIVMTDVEVLGMPLRAAQPWWRSQEVDLESNASIVTLKFAALDFVSPTRNRLAYRVRGLSDQWIDLGRSNRVTLTNLDSGRHELEVRAANADSVWSSEPLTISIRKATPFWQSPAAYAVYAFLLGWLIMYRVWLQRRRLQAAHDARERLEQEVEHRTQELRESNRLLEEAARVKEGFLARMSHELRTPMNGVIGMTDLMETTGLTTAQQRYNGTIRTSAQALLRILNDLLDLSKINAGKIELESGIVDLPKLLDECALLFSGACKRKNLELTVNVPEPEPPPFVGDPLRIRQILMNLIGNAVKFTQLGSIHIQARVPSTDAEGREWVEIQVSDTGIGIDPQVAARVFDPFTQADETTARRFGGTGLGLTICRELAQLMGGHIDLRSELGKGTTFIVTLPLRPASVPGQIPGTTDVAAESRATTLPDNRSLMPARILVVEDDPINATVAQGYLQQLGCTCVCVENGPSAFTKLGEEPFDLIFMDINMPGMDGFSTTAALRQRMAGQKRIPIIALTAHDANHYRQKCLAADMDDILSKPYTLEECAAVVRRWLPAISLRTAEQRAPQAPAPQALAEIDAATVAGIANLESPRQRDLYGRLVDLFEQSTAQRLAELSAALIANDLDAGAAVCHKLKSAAANVGALAFSAVVRQTESECRSGNLSAASALHGTLEAALPALLDSLRSQRRRLSA